MDEGALYELAESIKAQGVMQPVLVRPLARRGAEAHAASRSSPASAASARRAWPASTRCRCWFATCRDEAAAAMALIENIQREDLNPLEEARGLQRLIDEFGLTHEAAAQAVGRSRSATTNLLRLLNLSDPVQQMLLAGDLEMGHARALLPLERRAADHRGANEIVAKKLSVREAEKLVARLATASAAAAPLLRAKRQKVARHRRHRTNNCPTRLTAHVEIRVQEAHGHGASGRDRDRLRLARRAQRPARQARPRGPQYAVRHAEDRATLHVRHANFSMSRVNSKPISARCLLILIVSATSSAVSTPCASFRPFAWSTMTEA